MKIISKYKSANLTFLGDYVVSRFSVVSICTREPDFALDVAYTWPRCLCFYQCPVPAAEDTTPLEPQVSNLEAMDVDASALRTTISKEPPPEAVRREASEEARLSTCLCTFSAS